MKVASTSGPVKANFGAGGRTLLERRWLPARRHAQVSRRHGNDRGRACRSDSATARPWIRVTLVILGVLASDRVPGRQLLLGQLRPADRRQARRRAAARCRASSGGRSSCGRAGDLARATRAAPERRRLRRARESRGAGRVLRAAGNVRHRRHSAGRHRSGRRSCGWTSRRARRRSSRSSPTSVARTIDRVTLEAPLLAALAPGEKRRYVPLASDPEDHGERGRSRSRTGASTSTRASIRFARSARSSPTCAATSRTWSAAARSRSRSSRTRSSRPRRRCARKVQEQFMALVLESRFTKNQILELYLNDVMLGQRGPFEIHGVAEAARIFFGKDVQQRHARRGRDDRRPDSVAVAAVAVPQSRARAGTPQRRAARDGRGGLITDEDADEGRGRAAQDRRRARSRTRRRTSSTTSASWSTRSTRAC